MSSGRILAAWLVMLLLGALLWVAGGHKLGPAPTPTPTTAQIPTPSPPATSRPLGTLHPDEVVGRWAELSQQNTILVVEAEGDGVRIVAPAADAGSFQPSGDGFEEVAGDTIRRLKLDEDDQLQLLTSQLGGSGQRMSARVFTPEPEGDPPGDPKQNP